MALVNSTTDTLKKPSLWQYTVWFSHLLRHPGNRENLFFEPGGCSGLRYADSNATQLHKHSVLNRAIILVDNSQENVTETVHLSACVCMHVCSTTQKMLKGHLILYLLCMFISYITLNKNGTLTNLQYGKTFAGADHNPHPWRQGLSGNFYPPACTCTLM